MFRSMHQWFKVAREARATSSRSRPQQRPMRFEVLEDRALLTTFSVLNLADSGTGSLRAAVLAAEANPGADVIQFAKAVQGTITLTTGELLVSTDLSIKGPGANRVTISGNDASRVFHVLGGADDATKINVSISDLKVTHGSAAEGAGINHEGFANLTMAGMNISNNQASASGGGIFSLGDGAKLGLSNSIITENRVIGDGVDFSNGGGIGLHYGATAQIDSTTITGNRVVGSPNGLNGSGGGIETEFGVTVTLTNSTVSNNLVIGPTSSGDAHGGGITSSFGSTLNISKTTISGNEVRGGDGNAGVVAGEATGGAIDSAFGSVLHISASIITGNRAIGGSGNIGQALGGGIQNGFGGSAYILDSLISNNSAIAGKSGSSDVDVSVSTAFGGGISSLFSYLEVTRSVLLAVR